MKLIYKLLNRTTKAAVFFSVLLIFMLAFVSSCIKDVLDKAPSAYFSDDAVWKDANLIETFVDNTYRVITTGFSDRAAKLSGTTDECYRRGGGNNFINSGNMTPSQVGLLEFW